MVKPEVDSSEVRQISGLTIEQHDFRLILDSGTFYFFRPVILDTSKLYYSGFFEGRGRFQFHPSEHMEKNQLARFYDSDSLNRPFSRAMLLFNAKTAALLRDSGRLESTTPSRRTRSAIKEFQNFLATDERKYYLFTVLRNLAFPRKQPFLLVNTDFANSAQVMYIFDPYEQEEIRFLKHYDKLGYGKYMEPVCSYSIYADDNHEMINGINKDPLTAKHYDIDGVINKDGEYSGSARVSLQVEMSFTQMAVFGLYDSLTVDSILDSTGRKVALLSFKKKTHQDGGVYAVFPRTLNAQEDIALTFYYHGDIAETELGQFFLQAGAYWYPRTGFAQRATYAMRFRTPADYEFIATGKELERRKTHDTLYTRYEVTRPAGNISFNIGIFKKYSFGDSTATPVDVYFSEELHASIGSYLGEAMIATGNHMERQVGSDVLGALKLFTAIFGPQPADRTEVSEILQPYSESFPGFVHLGYTTWLSTDSWGFDRILRAHEVAHQWWGVGVGYQTYRDQWLSEGFSEYCALMYLQTVAGNDQFLDRLNDYRKDIFFTKGTSTSDKVEGAPVALGYRTSSTDNPDYSTEILYKKGAYVLHMLRNLLLDFNTMKDDRFVKLMHDYFATYRDSDITTADFQRLVGEQVGEDMSWFFDEWVYHSYLPTYDFEAETAGLDSLGCKIILHIKERNAPDNFKMYVPLEIDYDEGKAYVRVLVDRPQMDLPLELPQRPRKLIFNPFCSVLAKVNQ